MTRISTALWSAMALASSLALATDQADAQSAPNWSYGQVVTAGQIAAAFQTKQDRLNFTPLSKAGGTMTGKLQSSPSTVNGAGFALLLGVAPIAPSNGDLWATGTGLFAEIANQVVQLASTANVAAETARAQSVEAAILQGPTLVKLPAAPTAPPGSGSARIFIIPGTTSGTCAVAVQAGTSNTTIVIADNVGSGC